MRWPCTCMFVYIRVNTSMLAITPACPLVGEDRGPPLQAKTSSNTKSVPHETKRASHTKNNDFRRCFWWCHVKRDQTHTSLTVTISGPFERRVPRSTGWCLWKESNLQLVLRTDLLYPFNYRGGFCESFRGDRGCRSLRCAGFVSHETFYTSSISMPSTPNSFSSSFE